jgi:hypothetical protein
LRVLLVGLWSTKAIADVRQGAVSFEKDPVFGRKLNQLFVPTVVVWVEGDLLQVKTAFLGPGKKIHT